MTDLILAIALFVLAVAMVGLFAMMGELAARVPDEDAVVPPQPIEHAALGVVPSRWINDVAYVQQQDFGVVVVLSTSCTSCQRIASGATGRLDLPADAAVVISSPSKEQGERFIEDNPVLRQYRHVVDPGGVWLTEDLGVDISPSVLIFRHGRLISAHTFTSASVLADHFDSHAKDQEESHA